MVIIYQNIIIKMNTINQRPPSSMKRRHITTSRPIGKLQFDKTPQSIQCFIKTHPSQNCTNQTSSVFGDETHKGVTSTIKNESSPYDRPLLALILANIFEQEDVKNIMKTVTNMRYAPPRERDPETEADSLQNLLTLMDIFNFKKQLTGGPWPTHKVEEFLKLNSPSLSAQKEESHSTNNSQEMTEPEVPYMLYENDNTNQRKRRSTTNPASSQFTIDCDGIERDGRTTLMIKHIPNKYTEQMLFNELSRKFKNKINFLYLPLDPYNQCNMGYAFVNFVHTKYIRPFLEEFNGRRWNKFNSGKICELAYARIQGTNSLVSHFENALTAGGRWRGRTQPMDTPSGQYLPVFV